MFTAPVVLETLQATTPNPSVPLRFLIVRAHSLFQHLKLVYTSQQLPLSHGTMVPLQLICAKMDTRVITEPIYQEFIPVALTRSHKTQAQTYIQLEHRYSIRLTLPIMEAASVFAFLIPLGRVCQVLLKCSLLNILGVVFPHILITYQQVSLVF